MNWVNSLYIWMFIHYSTDCSKHMFHRLSKIFSSMSGYHNQTAIRCPFQIWMRIIFSHSSFQCINRSITSHENCFFFFPFFKKIILRKFSWCKIKLTNNAYCLTVKLFWIWAVDIICTQSCFYMPHRNL